MTDRDTLGTIVRHAGDLLVAWGADGRITFASPAAADLLGVAPDALLGEHWSTRVHPGDRATAEAAQAALAGGADRARATVRLRRGDGTPVWVESILTAVRDAAGAVREVVAATREVEDRVQAAATGLGREQGYTAALVASLHDGLVVADAEGCIVDVNRAMVRMTGFGRHELVGQRPPYPFWPPGGSPAIEAARAALPRAPGDHREDELTIRTRDGRPVPVLVTTSPLHGEQGRIVGWIGTFKDLSERIAAEAVLRDSEERYRSIVETAKDAIVTVDAEGRIETANPAAAALFGHDRDELVGRELATLIPGLDAAAPADSRARARRADGRMLPVHVSTDGMRVAGRGALTVVVRDESAAVAAEEELRRARDEQEALRGLAMTVAVEAPAEVVFARAAEIVARMIEVELGVVARFERAEARILGSWTAYDAVIEPRRELRGDGALTQVHRTGAPAVVEDYGMLAGEGDPAGIAGLLDGCASSIAHPVRVGGVLWGAVLVATPRRGEIPADALDRLGRVAHLVGLAVANADARERLAAQAMTDPVTGLANHRAFQERLAAEVDRARRHERALSLVLLDVDHFKQVNDELGHQAGDRLIAELGARLAGLARPGDLIARIGGDEFAWILPETEGMGAYAAAERGRQEIGGRTFAEVERMTLSAGVCDLSHAQRPDDLVRLADGALYWAKEHGRDVTYLYSPEVVRELSAAQRAQRLSRRQALTGIRALARAVDAKDPLTSRHSERVAEVATAIAEVCGWPDDRRALLHEAGLLHDVGKIGVPDAVLFKAARLTKGEYEQIKIHPTLGARIVDEVLGEEQVRWIREHHERIDGTGYPAGLRGDEISEGGRILALADAWDVMVSPRSYKGPMSVEQAIAELVRCAGTQFDAGLVERWSAAARAR